MCAIIGPVYARNDYAGFIRRTAALSLDLLLLFLIHRIGGVVLLSATPERWVAEDGYLLAEVEAWYWTSFWLLALLYMFGLRLTSGGTLGYRIVRIRYAYALGDKAPVLAILYRAGIAVFLLFFFLLDHVWIAFDERKQAWHDKVAGFYVVKCGARPIGTTRMNRRLIQFMMLTFPVWEPAGDEVHLAEAPV